MLNFLLSLPCVVHIRFDHAPAPPRPSVEVYVLGAVCFQCVEHLKNTPLEQQASPFLRLFHQAAFPSRLY